MWIGVLFAVGMLASSWWFQMRELRGTVEGLQREVELARDAQGKAVQHRAHCEGELIKANAQLQVFDRWLQLAAEARRPVYGHFAAAE